MSNKLENISKLIKLRKIDDAEFQISKLGPEFFKNYEYLYLRGEIFYLKKLYYIAIDTLLIALEFKEEDKIYDLISTFVHFFKISFASDHLSIFKNGWLGNNLS